MADQELLAGRVAIVTGAASGMGRVMARALAGAGARVAGVDIDAGGLDRLAAEPVFAGKLQKVITDVSQAAACRDTVQKVVDAQGGLDILINCAGISMFAAGRPTDSRVKFYEANPEGWQRILAINTVGSFLMARFAAPPMIKRGWGRIINVTTSFDTMMAAGLSAYGASKAALEAGSAIWAKDLAGTGVSVNILVPGGPTETEGFFPPGRPRPRSCSIPISWVSRWHGSRRPLRTVSAAAVSSRATGTQTAAGGGCDARAGADRMAGPGEGRNDRPRAADVGAPINDINRSSTVPRRPRRPDALESADTVPSRKSRTRSNHPASAAVSRRSRCKCRRTGTHRSASFRTAEACSADR